MNGCFYYNDKNKDEIKVGEYVKAKGGYIGKVERIVYDELTKENYYACGDNAIMASGFKEDIVKHSSNIIDLIECGDYVNGYKVLEVCSEKGWIDVDCNKQSEECTTIWEDDIKSIVTKEQYESVEFRLED